MNGVASSFSLQRGVALKWLLMAAIAMVAIATMAVTATARAQSSDAPNPPTGLTAETTTANSIRIAWQPPAANNCQISEYDILAEAQLSNRYVIDVRVPASQLRYELDNLDPATPHEIRVYAHSEDVGCNLGSTPAILEATTQAGPAPSNPRTAPSSQPVAPRLLNLPSQPQNVGYEISHNQLTVTWQQSTASGGCQVKDYVAVLIDDPKGKVADPTKYREQVIATNASPAAVFDNLTPEKAYYTYLAARGNASCDGDGYSPKVEHYFTTKPVPTPVPTQAPTQAPAPDNNVVEAITRHLDEHGNPLTQSEEPIYVQVVKDGTVYGNTGSLSSTFNVTEGSSGVHNVPIQVRLTDSPKSAVTLRFMFHRPNNRDVKGKQKAGANRDFHYMHRTLTWAANASGNDLSQTLNLSIIGDTRVEQNETVYLRVQEIRGTPLSADDRVRISPNGKKHSINVVIVNDDSN